MSIESISAITLATSNMKRAVKFYTTIGFELLDGGMHEEFTTFKVGETQYLNIINEGSNVKVSWWGRLIIYVSNVDEFYQHIIEQGVKTEFPPRDAPWHERYFHITDPDGHELSFAQPIH